MSGAFFLSILSGWLAGGLANWAADRLPTWGQEAPARRHWQHFWTLPWIWRRRACPGCGERRPWRAPLLEVAMAALFGWTWLLLRGQPLLLVIALLYSAFLLTVLVIDLEHRRVLNNMLAVAAITAMLLSFLPGMAGPVSALLGGVVGFTLFFLFYILGRGKLGAGDVKLAGVIGLMVGYPAVWTALAAGVLLGGLAALILLVSRRGSRKSTMAYAPYLAVGALITLWQLLH